MRSSTAPRRRRSNKTLAFVRGASDIRTGTQLERQTKLELVVVPARGGEERLVTEVRWIGNRYGHRPPTVLFGPRDETLYFTEFVEDALTLKRIRTDGLDELALYTFPHATRAVLSPDLRWIVYREYHRSAPRDRQRAHLLRGAA